MAVGNSRMGVPPALKVRCWCACCDIGHAHLHAGTCTHPDTHTHTSTRTHIIVHKHPHIKHTYTHAQPALDATLWMWEHLLLPRQAAVAQAVLLWIDRPSCVGFWGAFYLGVRRWGATQGFVLRLVLVMHLQSAWCMYRAPRWCMYRALDPWTERLVHVQSARCMNRAPDRASCLGDACTERLVHVQSA